MRMMSVWIKGILFFIIVSLTIKPTMASFLSDQRSSFFPKFMRLADLHLQKDHAHAYSINISLYHEHQGRRQSQGIGFVETMVGICSRREKSDLTVLGSSPPILICLSKAQLEVRAGTWVNTLQDVAPVFCGDANDGPCGGRYLHTGEELVVLYTNKVYIWRNSLFACADIEWIIQNKFIDLHEKKTIYECLESCDYFVRWNWWSVDLFKGISQVCYCLRPNSTLRMWDLRPGCTYWSPTSLFPGPTSLIRWGPHRLGWTKWTTDHSAAIYCKKSSCSNDMFIDNKVQNLSSVIDRFFKLDSKCIAHQTFNNSLTPFLNETLFPRPRWDWEKNCGQKCACFNASEMYLISGRECRCGPTSALKPSLQLYQACHLCTCWDEHPQDICQNRTYFSKHRLNKYCGLAGVYYSAYRIHKLDKGIKFLQCVSANITNKFKFYSEESLIKNINASHQEECFESCSSFVFTLMSEVEDNINCYCLPRYFRFSILDLSELCLSSWSTVTGLPISQKAGAYSVYYNASSCGHNCPSFINSFIKMDQNHFCDTLKGKSYVSLPDPKNQTGITYHCYRNKTNQMWSLRQQQRSLKPVSKVTTSTSITSTETDVATSVFPIEAASSSISTTEEYTTKKSPTFASSTAVLLMYPSSTEGYSTSTGTTQESSTTASSTSSTTVSSSTVETVQCKSVDDRGELWNSTVCGEVIHKCPNGTTGNATWYCDCGIFLGDQPDRTNCREEWIDDIENMITNEKMGSVNISRKLFEMLTLGEDLTAGGLMELPSILSRLINLHQIELEDSNSINRTEFTSNVVSSLNDAIYQELAWAEISNVSQRINVTNTILAQIELICYTRLKNENQPIILFLNKTNLSVNITNAVTAGSAVEFKSPGAEIIIPNGWTTADSNVDTSDKNVDTFGRNIDMVVFALNLRDTRIFFPNISHPETIRNGWLFNTIISISFDQEDIIKMEDNFVKITFHQMKNKTMVDNCVFWSPFTESWQKEGCHTDQNPSTRDETICLCNHLTNFGILFDVGGFVDAGDKVLGAITTLLGSISCVCIFITLLSLCRVRKLNHLRYVIEFNRNICLLCGMITFLGLVDLPAKVDIPVILCQFIGILTHYIWLAFFAWTGLEGFLLYKALVTVFDNGNEKKFPYYLFGYAAPAVLVIGTIITCLLIKKDDLYTRAGTCWIHIKYIWAFVVPVYTVIIFNIVILFIGLTVAYKAAIDTRTMNARQKLRTCCRNCIVLSCLLGISWSTGIYYKPVWAQYSFVILNSSCGIIIFSYSVLFNPKVRQELVRIYTRRGSSSGGFSWTWKSVRTNSQGMAMAERRNTISNITN